MLTYELNIGDVTDEKFLRDMLEYSKFFEYYPKVNVTHITSRKSC